MTSLPKSEQHISLGIVCIISTSNILYFYYLGKRERLLDHYIYHNPGGVGWRTADDKERLSGNTEGGYHYGSTFFMN